MSAAIRNEPPSQRLKVADICSVGVGWDHYPDPTRAQEILRHPNRRASRLGNRDDLESLFEFFREHVNRVAVLEPPRFSRRLKHNFEALTEAVRRGGVPPSSDNAVSDDNPIWVEFARTMGPMMVPAAHAIAEMVAGTSGALKVLDIAAGHGLFGITIAQRNPLAQIVAADWPAVLAVASENARSAQVQDRYRALPGDAFKVDFPSGFDVALVTNFLHHFDQPTCTNFLRKVHAALTPGGRVVVLEFVPNPDRVSPPVPARFSLTMLAGTPSGDAYTFAELQHQLEDAGFRNVSAHALPTPETVLLAQK